MKVEAKRAGDRSVGSPKTRIKSRTSKHSLHPDARTLIDEIRTSYAIADAAGLSLLERAGEALTRLRDAQAQIAEQGATIVDRFGQRKAHPLLSCERDARRDFIGALKSLNLDLEPLRDGPGRPPGAS
jgi:hypothetical protein